MWSLLSPHLLKESPLCSLIHVITIVTPLTQGEPTVLTDPCDHYCHPTYSRRAYCAHWSMWSLLSPHLLKESLLCSLIHVITIVTPLTQGEPTVLTDPCDHIVTQFTQGEPTVLTDPCDHYCHPTYSRRAYCAHWSMWSLLSPHLLKESLLCSLIHVITIVTPLTQGEPTVLTDPCDHYCHPTYSRRAYCAHWSMWSLLSPHLLKESLLCSLIHVITIVTPLTQGEPTVLTDPCDHIVTQFTQGEPTVLTDPCDHYCHPTYSRRAYCAHWSMWSLLSPHLLKESLLCSLIHVITIVTPLTQGEPTVLTDPCDHYCHPTYSRRAYCAHWSMWSLLSPHLLKESLLCSLIHVITIVTPLPQGEPTVLTDPCDHYCHPTYARRAYCAHWSMWSLLSPHLLKESLLCSLIHVITIVTPLTQGEPTVLTDPCDHYCHPTYSRRAYCAHWSMWSLLSPHLLKESLLCSLIHVITIVTPLTQGEPTVLTDPCDHYCHPTYSRRAYCAHWSMWSLLSPHLLKESLLCSLIHVITIVTPLTQGEPTVLTDPCDNYCHHIANL